MIKLKTNKLFSIILFSMSFLIITFSIYYITKINKEERIEKVKNTHLVKLKTHFEVIQYNNNKNADVFYTETINKNEVIDILSKVNTPNLENKLALKNDLYNQLSEQYKRMLAVGIFQFNFILPSNEVFLYMHDKEKKYSNTVKRDDYEKVNKTQVSLKIFHKGEISHGYKNLYPIFDKKHNHLGSLEITYNSNFLQNSLTNISKIHTHFLIHKDLFKNLEWDLDSLLIKYKQSGEHKDYLVSILTEHNTIVCGGKKHGQRIAPILNDNKINIDKGKAFSLYMDFEDNIGVTTFYPIKDSNRKVVSWIYLMHKIILLKIFF